MQAKRNYGQFDMMIHEKNVWCLIINNGNTSCISTVGSFGSQVETLAVALSKQAKTVEKFK